MTLQEYKRINNCKPHAGVFFFLRSIQNNTEKKDERALPHLVYRRKRPENDGRMVRPMVALWKGADHGRDNRSLGARAVAGGSEGAGAEGQGRYAPCKGLGVRQAPPETRGEDANPPEDALRQPGGGRPADINRNRGPPGLRPIGVVEPRSVPVPPRQQPRAGIRHDRRRV